MLTKEERETFLKRLKEEGLFIIRDAEEKYRDDKIIMMGLVKINGAILGLASDRLRKEDTELINAALENENDYLGTFNGKKHSFTIEFVDKEYLKNNPKYILDFLSRNMEYAKILDNDLLEIKEVREYVLENIDRNIMLWFDLPETERFDKKVVLKVINQMPNMVEKLPLTLQCDLDVIKEASKDHDPDFNAVEAMYGHLDPIARKNPDICKVLVEADPRVFPQLEYKDAEIIKIALAYNGDYLSCLDENDRDNEEYVSIALASDGLALSYASPRLQDDEKIVEIALKQSGWSINSASQRLQNTPSMVDKALNTSPELSSYGWSRSSKKQ